MNRRRIEFFLILWLGSNVIGCRSSNTSSCVEGQTDTNCLCPQELRNTLTQYGIEYCNMYLTWPVRKDLFPNQTSYENAIVRAKSYYVANKNATFQDSDASGTMNENLLSYQPYWGCVLVRCVFECRSRTSYDTSACARLSTHRSTLLRTSELSSL